MLKHFITKCLLTLIVSVSTLTGAHAAPTVTISTTDGSAAEQNRNPGAVRISRTGATTASLTVRYTLSGTATNGKDYDTLTGTATIAAGQASTTVSVRPIDDTTKESTESVVVTLAANTAYVLSTLRTATVNIADNDSTSLLPVLMVIANNDFYYTEYATPRRELELAGLRVVVAAGRRELSTPHANTGQGSSSGQVMPDIDLASARAANYSAIIFVGGWGASQYQYAFSGTYNHGAYNATPAIRSEANRLINEFASQNKYVCGLCHGVSVLAWARVNGQSPVRGRTVTTAAFSSPASNIPEAIDFRWHSATNGAAVIYVGGSYGNQATYADDVIVDGRIITGGNQDSSSLFGKTVANRVLGR